MSVSLSASREDPARNAPDAPSPFVPSLEATRAPRASRWDAGNPAATGSLSETAISPSLSSLPLRRSPSSGRPLTHPLPLPPSDALRDSRSRPLSPDRESSQRAKRPRSVETEPYRASSSSYRRDSPPSSHSRDRPYDHSPPPRASTSQSYSHSSSDSSALPPQAPRAATGIPSGPRRDSFKYGQQLPPSSSSQHRSPSSDLKSAVAEAAREVAERLKRRSSEVDPHRPLNGAPAPPPRSTFAQSPSTSSSRPPPPPPPLSTQSRPVQRRPPSPIQPDFYKPLGTRDFRVVYDPAVDPSPVKKGKEVIYRYDGDGIAGRAFDPRKVKVKDGVEKAAKPKVVLRQQVAFWRYEWDKNSTGPPPPRPPHAVLITGFPSSTTPDQIHRHFAAYGRIKTQEDKVDPKTGGSLGICWIQYADDAPRSPDADRAAKEKFERDKRKGTAQDGNLVALHAIAKGNGSKIGARMLMSAGGVKVQMDGDGALCKPAVDAETLRRHPPTSKPPPPPPSLSTQSGSSSSAPRPPPLPFNNSAHPSPLSNGVHPPQRQPYGGPDGRPWPSQLPTPGHLQPPPPPPPPQRAAPPPPPPPQRFPSHPLPPPPQMPYPGSRGSFDSGPNVSFPSNSFRPLPPRPMNSHPHVPTVVPPFPPSASLPPRNPIVPRGPAPSGYRGGVGGQASSMSLAVAAAVLAAKKRLEAKQKKSEKKETAGEADMELDSGAEDNQRDSDDSDEEAELPEEAIFFHRDGRSERRMILPKGMAPAAAIAWQASPQVLREKLAANGNSYIFISKTEFYAARDSSKRKQPPVLNGTELEAHFGAFALDKTYADTAGWYITFLEPDAARLAHEKLDQTRFAGAQLTLVVRESPSAPPRLPSPPPAPEVRVEDLRAATLRQIGALNKTKQKKTSGWTDAELVDEARDIIIKDLMEAFKNDVKNRVMAGNVYEHLAKWEAAGSRSAVAPSSSTPSTSTTKAPPPTTATTDLKLELVDTPPSKNLVGSLKSLSSLPSFARRKPNARLPLQPSRRSSETPSDSRATPIDTSDSEHGRSELPSARSKHSKSKSSQVVKERRKIESASEEERVEKAEKPRRLVSPKKKESRAPRVQLEYTSSEDDDDEPEAKAEKKPILPPPPPHVEVVPIEEPIPQYSSLVVEEAIIPTPAELPRPKKRPPPKKSTPIPVPADDAILVDSIEGMPTPAPTDDTTSTTAKQPPSNVDSDDSDVIAPAPKSTKVSATGPSKRRKIVSTRTADEKNLTPDPFARGIAEDEEDLYYVKLAIERPRIGLPLHPTPPPNLENEDEIPLRHPTGCARTEGYYPISVAEKMANRPATASSSKAKAAFESSTAGGTSGVAVSRLARANTRGLVRGMELHKKVTASDTDVLKFNQLKTRKKQLTFSRSGIEGYGLFAKEHIPAGEMVIEYVGELVRQQVADRREKAYERQGIGSSYLFRVDEDLVVDATKKGNLGRLINHCCAPNCTARIITINGVKKIVIYAKTNIEPGDEVTYDYHFPHEEVKIPCLCGHQLCRKYLN